MGGGSYSCIGVRPIFFEIKLLSKKNDHTEPEYELLTNINGTG